MAVYGIVIISFPLQKGWVKLDFENAVCFRNDHTVKLAFVMNKYV